MAVHSANGVTVYLAVPAAHKDDLGAIRHWDNLKIAFEAETVWLKELTPAQAESIEVKSLPYKTLYYAAGPQLFLQGSLLPDRAVPSVLWSPIERGLPVTLPAGNHNFFGVREKAAVSLARSDDEREPFALAVSLKALRTYVEGAPSIRLKHLRWVLVDETEAVVLGAPLLPLQGEAFWRAKDFLFPAGYALERPLLMETLQQLLNPQGEDWNIWNREGSYWKLPKETTKPLSIASVRQSLKPSA